MGWTGNFALQTNIIAWEQRSFTLDDMANMSASQEVTRRYNAFGKLTASIWQDGQQWRITYDERSFKGRWECLLSSFND